MIKSWMIFPVILAVCCILPFSAGCESDAQTGGLIGTGAGAGIGQAVGHDTGSTLIGAGIGGAAGYIIGNEQDKKKQTSNTQTENNSIKSEQNIVTVWITNSNGSQTAVKLTKDGPGYIGPRGERYATMPTDEQLKQVYGF